ncbi:alpha/beta hydrolase [Nocardia africana]|uniref:Alpha/beta hydrolase n=1 Tax=Nocardia africana TaxID=134964 RepID=A0ABW6NI24_9NOCA
MAIPADEVRVPTPFPLDPQLANAAAPLLSAMARATPPLVGDWATRRTLVTTLLRRLSLALPENEQITRSSREIVTVDGGRIPATWYEPPGRGAGPAAVFLHGGGMILGSVAVFDRMISKYVADSGVPLLAVDYRLAPEHPHPAPVEDCFAAVVWLHENAAELGVDPGRIGIVGESAGGGLAAAVALLARDRGGPPIARQMLVQPMLDDRTIDPDPHIAPHAFWTYDDNETGWRALLGEHFRDGSVEPYAAPGRCTEFHCLPPAYLEVGEIDIFRDETVRYASGLAAAGVTTELHVIPGVTHSFEWVAPRTDASVRSMAGRVRWLRML